jgi:hypothetical protein
VGDEVTLSTSLPENAEIAALVGAFQTNLNDILKEDAVRTAASHASADGSYYLGVSKCAECHQKEFDVWSGTKHAQAFQTLVAVNSDALPECYRCHVTGADDPAGYMPGADSSRSLANVQCEVCHGKGSHHARDGSWGQGLLKNACAKCHDPHNSPDFDLEVYWDKIRH